MRSNTVLASALNSILKVIAVAFICVMPLGGPLQVQAENFSMDDILKLRDPFHKEDGIFLKDRKIRSELELIPLEDLKMIGMVTGPAKPKAMILAPNGKTYFITLNDKVGNQEGLVIRIAADYVEVRERVVNLLGQEEKLTSRIVMVGNPKDLGRIESGNSGGNNDGTQVLPFGMEMPAAATPPNPVPALSGSGSVFEQFKQKIQNQAAGVAIPDPTVQPVPQSK